MCSPAPIKRHLPREDDISDPATVCVSESPLCSLSLANLCRFAPLKPKPFARKRHELDSPNLGGRLPHLSTPCSNLHLRRTEMGCGLQG
ncbi:hypothetical protein AVEN_110749-1 [Araneus ventricosus]|uniref:Uncharacterized protein n=1 Tax=Araneus ventricosus TaxID=182803 RepID=A0A4Y2LDB0_ARAVE|nr:hypothetical protein AVEN_110749-1 [Araneus ventricosus]